MSYLVLYMQLLRKVYENKISWTRGKISIPLRETRKNLYICTREYRLHNSEIMTTSKMISLWLPKGLIIAFFAGPNLLLNIHFKPLLFARQNMMMTIVTRMRWLLQRLIRSESKPNQLLLKCQFIEEFIYWKKYSNFIMKIFRISTSLMEEYLVQEEMKLIISWFAFKIDYKLSPLRIKEPIQMLGTTAPLDNSNIAIFADPCHTIESIVTNLSKTIMIDRSSRPVNRTG